MKKSEVKHILQQFVSTHNRFPKTSEIAGTLQIKQNQVKPLMEILVNDRYLQPTDNGWYRIAPQSDNLPVNNGRHNVIGEIGRTNNKTSSPNDIKPQHKEEFVSLPPTISIEHVASIEDPNTKIQENETKEPTTNNPINEQSKIVGMLHTFANNLPFKKEEILNISKKLHEFKRAKNKNISNVYSAPIRIIRVSMALIGLGAAIISMYYTSIWMFEFLPKPLALLLASIMVGFSVMDFEMVVLFVSGQITTHWSRWVIAVFFLILWVVVGAFSISSTIAGQYNKYVQKLEDSLKKNQGENASQIRWLNIQDKKKEITQRIQEKREQRNQLNTLISGITTVTSQEAHANSYGNAQWRIQQIDIAIDNLNTELEQTRNEEKEEIKLHPTLSKNIHGINSLPDFYQFIANIFSIGKDTVQFWCSLFPAVFVDIIAPVGVAVALFLRRKEDE